MRVLNWRRARRPVDEGQAKTEPNGRRDGHQSEGQGRPLRPLRLRSFRSANPSGERVFYHNIWFRGHNNPRYAQLLPRLHRLDPFVVTCSDQRIVRGLQFRALRATRRLRNRLVFALAARRYQYTFTTDIEQIPFIRGPVVVDIDDPNFTVAEVELLSHDNVAVYVVTNDAAAREFERMGVRTPHLVVPQGVDHDGLDPAAIDDVATRVKRPGELVVGFVAAWLLTGADHDGQNPMYNIDHLLELWERLRRELPDARLWLIGQPSERVRRACTGRDDVLLLGRLPQPTTVAHVANFDIALYPRRKSAARFRAVVKIAEYLACGVPTVAYDLDETKVLADTQAGLLARDADSFVAAVLRLARDDAARLDMAARARAAGDGLDWNRLASMYERDVFDVFLSGETRP
jgi:glycosyltransferase involved in cell wall biosynthesis